MSTTNKTLSIDESRAKWRRRDHADIEAMQNRIIQRVTDETGVVMLSRVRAFISALQSAHGGGEVPHEPFKRSHLTVAQYLQFTGTDVAKQARVRRLIKSLNAYQEQAGVKFFQINPGGDIITLEDGTQSHSTTEYIDLLKPLADSAVIRARESELWKTHPGKAKEAQAERAMSHLVRINKDAQTKDRKNDRYAPPLNVRLARNRSHAASRLRANFELLRETDGDVVAYAENFAIEILDRANAIAQADAATGIKTGTRVTNLLPSPSEDVQKIEQKPSMLNMALEYAAFDEWPVFPCRPDKSPYTPNGFKDASTDPARVKFWWRKWPDALIGVPTGARSGLLVVDVDPRNGGDESLTKLIDKYGELPTTLEAMTGGNGSHFFYQYPNGSSIRKSAGKLGQGIDVCADGGYIIVAPSLHASGRRYEWRPDGHEPAPAPDWLLTLLQDERHKSSVPQDSATRLMPHSYAALEGLIAEGSRNDTLFRRIGAPLAGKGASIEEIEAAVIDANERYCRPSPLTNHECRTIAASAFRLEAQKRA